MSATCSKKINKDQGFRSQDQFIALYFPETLEDTGGEEDLEKAAKYNIGII